MKRMNATRDAQEPSAMRNMDAQTRMLYARRVKAARIDQGRTQEDVAQAAGISRNTLASMEAGQRAPQWKSLWAVMLELNLTLDTTEPEWLQEWWRTIVPLAKRLPESRRGEVFGDIIGVLRDAL